MYSSLIIERHYKISIMFIVTIVTVWAECCCKLVHMKVHDQDFMLMCHLQYSVQKFSIHGEHEYNMSNSVLTTSQGQVVHLGSTSTIECFIYLGAIENEILGISLNISFMYQMWCTV